MADMGFIGPHFTWSHGNDVQQRKVARLDRAPADISWQQKYPEASVAHCAHAYSDHCPLLLCTKSARLAPMGVGPFRFEAACLSDKRFMEFTEKN